MSTPPADGPTPGEPAEGLSPDEAAAQLEVLRVRLNDADRRLEALLQRRAQLVVDLCRLSRSAGLPIWQAAREPRGFARSKSAAERPLDASAVQAVYREIESVCRALTRRLQVAYLGPEGTFSEQAVRRQFGSAVEAQPCASFDEVFRAVEAGTAEFGVVPVENSTEGAVNRTLDLFLQSPLRICAEVLVPVEHSLMNQSGRLDSITRVCAHPQALAQCAGWLDQQLPGIERLPVASNAEGARQAAADPTLAGIAAASAAQRYGLTIVRRAIQDNPDNRTRFVVIGKAHSAPSGNDQTSLILSVPDEAGAVHRLIEPLARHGVSMKRFESRPARQQGWEYFFYIDVLGHTEDPAVRAALAEIRLQTTFYKEVGSYPRSPAT